MATVEIVPPEKPEVHLTLSWDEAVELRNSLGKISTSYVVFEALRVVEEDD